MFGLLALTGCATPAPPPALIGLTSEIPTTLRAPCPTSSRPQIPAGLDVGENFTLDELIAAYRARGAFIATLADFATALEADAAECEAMKDLGVALLDAANAAAGALHATPASGDGLRGR